MEISSLPVFMDREIIEFAKQKETRTDYTPHSVKYYRDKFIGNHWVVVFQKGKGRWKEYIYDWVILLPNGIFVFFPDCCYPTKEKIVYNWKEV